MKTVNKILLIFFFVVVFFIIFLYGFFLFGIPKIVNSKFFIKKIEQKINQKTGYDVSINQSFYKSLPNLQFNFYIKKVVVKNSKTGKNVFSARNIYYASKKMSVKPQKIDIEFIYLNCEKFFEKNPKSKNRFKLSTDLLALINIDKIFVHVNKNTNMVFHHIISVKNGNNVKYKIQGEFLNKLFPKPVKIGSDGNIIFDGKNLKFENYSLKIDNTKLFISGLVNNLRIKGQDLPVAEIKDIFLTFYRISHNNKKNFIENFNNLSGKLDVDILVKSNMYSGQCIIKNVTAKFSSFLIPVRIPLAVFKFKDRNITAKTIGFVDKERSLVSFCAKNIFTQNAFVYGDIKSKIGHSFVKKYVPDLSLKGKSDIKIVYNTQNNKVNVRYFLDLKPDNDISYKNYTLGNGKRERLLVADTVKVSDSINISKYVYYILVNNKKIPIIQGKGALKKQNGKYEPDYLTLKTLRKIPLIAVSFLMKNFIEGGYFSSDLKFEFPTKTLKGYLDLHDVYHKDFLFLKNVHLEIFNNTLYLTSNGTFFESPITLSVVADNNFHNNILVHSIDIHLKKFIVKREKYDRFPHEYKNYKMPKLKKRNYDIDIESGRIIVDEIVHSKFYLHDVEIIGNLKDDIAQFTTSPTDYSKGELIAVGKYNIADHSSDIEFFATDIDSNEVVSKIFNLPDYVEGVASASLHLITKNKLNDIKADASFIIEKGSLPKIGSTEFMFKRTDKFKKFKFLNFDKIKFTLSKITNIDFSTQKTPPVAYIMGNFNLDNELLKNAEIFFTSDIVSMFIEGNYNIDSQYADLYIWGRHNKTAEKKIRILKIPFSWLYRLVFKAEKTKGLYDDKISKIPPINLKSGDIESIFRVIVEGNINSDNLKFNLKDLR